MFAFLIKILYLPVPPCDQEAEICFEIWEAEADSMRNGSLDVFYGLVGLIFAALIGFTVMFWGFGVGSERTSKIVRDKSFSNVLRQEVRIQLLIEVCDQHHVRFTTGGLV